MLYVTRMTNNENDSINSMLQHGRVVGNNCCVVFPASGFPYLILCPRQCKFIILFLKKNKIKHNNIIQITKTKKHLPLL